MLFRLRHGRAYLCFRSNYQPYCHSTAALGTAAAAAATAAAAAAATAAAVVDPTDPMTASKYECITAATIHSRPYRPFNRIIQKELRQ